MHNKAKVSDFNNGEIAMSPTAATRTDSEIADHSTLQTVTRNGDMETLRLMLRNADHVARINDLDDSGMSALHYAARANNFEAVALLLKQGHANPRILDEEGATPLHYAARKKKSSQCDDTAEVVNLLVRHCDVNIRDKYASSPLHFAAMRGNIAAAKALLQQPTIIVNAKDHLGCTPLHEAATYNHPEVADLLIRHGAKVSMKDNDSCTPLHLAAIEGFSEIVDLILKRVDPEYLKDLIHHRDKDDTMAIHYAVESRNLRAVKLLLKQGARVNSTCRNNRAGSTPLHLAAIAGEPKVTRHLLDHGASINGRDRKQATPLHKAAEYDCVKDAKEIMKRIEVNIEAQDLDNYTPLMTAVAYGSDEITQALLDEGADINVHDAGEKSMIYIAVENDQTECLKILLDHVRGEQTDGDSVTSSGSWLINHCDRHGDSPLHVAATRGNPDIVMMLLDDGADHDMKNENEETPFLKACEHGHNIIVLEMIRRDEKIVNDEDEDSNSALHLAAEEGHIEVVTTLVEWGAEKEARNNRSRTPLDLTAQSGHVDVVRYLLDEDVSPNPVDKEMVTPLQMASKNGHDAVVSLLIERNADVKICDVEGNNCLDIAIEYGKKSVVSAILKSKAWYIALGNESRIKFGQPRDTPLRKLFREMPDMAPMALDCCVTRGPDNVNPGDPRKFVDLNYDYLDDTYTDYDALVRQPLVGHLKEDSPDNVPKLESRPYHNDLNYIKANHPLTILVEEERENLLGHPLVLTLIREKWKLARIFYFLYMTYYMLYLCLITSFMLIAEPPYEMNMTECEMEDEWDITNFEFYGRYFIWALAAVGLAIEIFQLTLQRLMYFSFSNLLDWFSFVSAIVLMLTFTNCGARTDWQWQMGAFTVLMTWLDLILFLRRLPGLGIYVVMITEIFMTFLRFFVAFFLFIVAFALTFFILVQNQDEFGTEFYSIAKSIVMMIGEFDYGDMFFNEDEEEAVPYEATTYAVFLLFAFIVSIIVMNLLIGLAVDDVNGLREHAKVVKLSMQIELALDVELALPYKWARSNKCNSRRNRFWPNEERTRAEQCGEAINSIIEGPLLSEKAVKKSLHQQNFRGRLPELMELEERIHVRIKNSRTEVRQVATKLDKIERMLGFLVEEYKKSKERGDSDDEGNSGGGGGGGGSGPDDGAPPPPPRQDKKKKPAAKKKAPLTRPESSSHMQVDIAPLRQDSHPLPPLSQRGEEFSPSELSVGTQGTVSPTQVTHSRFTTSEA